MDSSLCSMCFLSPRVSDIWFVRLQVAPTESPACEYYKYRSYVHIVQYILENLQVVFYASVSLCKPTNLNV
jgi:hypothetical protein